MSQFVLWRLAHKAMRPRRSIGKLPDYCTSALHGLHASTTAICGQMDRGLGSEVARYLLHCRVDHKARRMLRGDLDAEDQVSLIVATTGVRPALRPTASTQPQPPVSTCCPCILYLRLQLCAALLVR